MQFTQAEFEQLMQHNQNFMVGKANLDGFVAFLRKQYNVGDDTQITPGGKGFIDKPEPKDGTPLPKVEPKKE